MSYSENEYLMISGIQHYMFCRRQWALAYIDNIWADNYLTAEGEVIHGNAHKEDYIEKRPGVLVTRGLWVSSPVIGMSGQCDVVEFWKAKNGAKLHGHRGLWQAVPVEYKHGKPKEDDSDIFQLCCEAMCLENMLACEVPSGYLYYYTIRRRQKIEFTQEMRDRVIQTAHEMHQVFSRGYIPKVKHGKKCQSCSIKELCLPKLCQHPSVTAYVESALEGKDDI